MKKTLFLTACLLSSLAVAQAATIATDTINQTLVSGNSDFNWSTLSDTLESWALSFTLNSSSDLNGYFISTTRSSTSGARGLLVGVTSSTIESVTTSLLYLYATNSNGTAVITDTLTLEWDESHTYTLAYDAVTQTFYLADTSTGECISHTFTDEELSSVASTSLTRKTESNPSYYSTQWTNNGYEKSTVISVADISSIAGNSSAVVSYITTGAVPEPATASLSLLGLGALLLRRRRN